MTAVETEPLVDMSAGVISELLHLAGPIAGLRSRLRLLGKALEIQRSLSEKIKETLGERECEDDEDKMAIHFAANSPAYLKRNYDDTKQLLDLLEAMFEAQSSTFASLDKDDIEAVGSLLRILATLKQRSKRNLKMFLAHVEARETGWMLMRVGFKEGLDARFRPTVSESIKKCFDLQDRERTSQK